MRDQTVERERGEEKREEEEEEEEKREEEEEEEEKKKKMKGRSSSKAKLRYGTIWFCVDFLSRYMFVGCGL